MCEREIHIHTLITHCSDCPQAAQPEWMSAPPSRHTGPLVEDASDVERSEEDSWKRKSPSPASKVQSALQEHNAIHGREQREIVTPNVLGTSRFNLKAFCHFCFLGGFTPDV